jgi:hypothetical protein
MEKTASESLFVPKALSARFEIVIVLPYQFRLISPEVSNLKSIVPLLSLLQPSALA